VTPLAFYASQGKLWLRAVCHLDDTTKDFRCDRIRGVREE
jgi:predicted DNA-binding transcriptional regulator YafY